jgi:hypothetical protein
MMDAALKDQCHRRKSTMRMRANPCFINNGCVLALSPLHDEAKEKDQPVECLRMGLVA